MKLRKEKEQIPADFRKQMYENYKANMTFFMRLSDISIAQLSNSTLRI